jgi:hypothetical protein
MPRFTIISCKRQEVLPLFEAHHGYKSLGHSLTYCFGVVEEKRIIAAYVWQPPPPGAAKGVCPEAPHAVLSLSRMVAVPKGERRLRHISKPLRYQMKWLIDRTRWPVLLTYHDEGQGHTGHVYKCSGWQPTARALRPTCQVDGKRVSAYRNGYYGERPFSGKTWIQRWEHRVCPQGEAHTWLENQGWQRIPIPGKVWRSGTQAYTYRKTA